MIESMPMAITAYTATSCAGRGLTATRSVLNAERTFLQPCQFLDVALRTWVGEVDGLDDQPVANGFEPFDCRNNRLAQVGLLQDDFLAAVERVRARYGQHRIGVFLGTSTSGLLNAELAYRHRDAVTGTLPAGFHYAQTQNMGSLAAFVRAYLALTGPMNVGSIACASSAKVFASGARALQAGLVDAAIVGGVDTLCLTTLYGFGSLELLAPNACQPYGAERNGISIGEAAAFILMERPSPQNAASPVLAGYGESSDAHHMSAPHPEGLGAQRAIRDALRRAACAPAQIDYVNLHGTATPSNDAAEDAAMYSVFGDSVPVSSTKGAVGHTLGAAGGLEAVLSLLALDHGMIPGGLNAKVVDPALKSDYRLSSEQRQISRVMSNSFGFGGANAALIFASRADQ